MLMQGGVTLGHGEDERGHGRATVWPGIKRAHALPSLQAVGGAAVLLCAYLFSFWRLGGLVPGIPAGHSRSMAMLEVRPGRCVCVCVVRRCHACCQPEAERSPGSAHASAAALYRR